MNRIFCMMLAIVFPASVWAQASYTEVYRLPSTEKHYISSTHYDYSKVAGSLTEGCKTDFEKIEAIYDWMTRTISYDTSYSIHTADECFDEKKGVCQAYCELFYRIAEAAGVRVDIISGISRDIYGEVQDGGHSWLFAYTRENYGLLLDPTWDAGTVNGRVFTRADYRRAWFGVDPRWMILTHFPEKESDQLLPNPMSKDEFCSMKYPIRQGYYVYGFDVGRIYAAARAGTLSIPEVYSGGYGELVILDAPLQEELHVGTEYMFRVRMLAEDKELILLFGGNWLSTAKGRWKDEGNGVYSIKFVPNLKGSVSLNLRGKGLNESAQTIVDYKVPAPTEEEIQRLEEVKQALAAERNQHGGQ